MPKRYNDNVQANYDENGSYHGEYKHWHKCGILKEHSHHRHGYQHGELKRWLNTGMLSVHTFYKVGRLHGEFRRWWEDGKQNSHAYYVDGYNMTEEVTNMLGDILNPTDEDRLLVKLKWGINLC